MKRIIAFIIFSISFAFSSDYFIGAEYSNTIIKEELSIDLNSSSFTSDNRSYGIKFGKIIDREHRVYLGISSYETNINDNLKTLSFNYDYLYSFDFYKLYLTGGASCKLSQYDIDLGYYDLSAKGFNFSGNIALAYNLNNFYSWEAGIRKSIFNNISSKDIINSKNFDFNISKFDQLYFGINIKIPTLF